MNRIKQSVEIISSVTESEMISMLGKVLNVPYAKYTYTEQKTKDVIRSCVKKGHLSVLEHCHITLKCVTNIGTYKDYTRHRHCAFTIESTSFTNYKTWDIITCEPLTAEQYSAMDTLFNTYKAVLNTKMARDFIPQNKAAVMILTTNIRELRWIIGLRRDPNDNPLTNELAILMWETLSAWYPFFFPKEGTDCMAIRDEWNPDKPAASL